MVGAALAGLGIAAAVAAMDGMPPQPATLELSESWFAEPKQLERIDVRSFKERRRGARANALAWMGAPIDDRELLAVLDRGEDPAALVDPEEGGAVTADGASIVWNRPSLLTLGSMPGQPETPEWLRWQAAIDRARARRAAAEAARKAALEESDRTAP